MAYPILSAIKTTNLVEKKIAIVIKFVLSLTDRSFIKYVPKDEREI